MFFGDSTLSRGQRDLLLIAVSIIAGCVATYHFSKNFETEELSSGHSLLDIVNMLHDRSEPIHVDDLEALWQKYDNDANGYLDINEVRHLLSHLWEVQTDLVRAESAERAQRMRQILETAKHDAEEVSEIVHRISHPRELRVCEHNLKKMREKGDAACEFFKDLDVAHDGKISKQVFLTRAPDGIRKALGLPMAQGVERFVLEQEKLVQKTNMKFMNRRGSVGDM
jgi:Ca2+-binding EF-hand superfamily protein